MLLMRTMVDRESTFTALLVLGCWHEYVVQLYRRHPFAELGLQPLYYSAFGQECHWCACRQQFVCMCWSEACRRQCWFLDDQWRSIACLAFAAKCFSCDHGWLAQHGLFNSSDQPYSKLSCAISCPTASCRIQNTTAGVSRVADQVTTAPPLLVMCRAFS